MQCYDWDRQLEYLLHSRNAMFNDDYLAFLVERVWRIKDTIRIIDLGCGLGYLGYKLLPILPEGSEYVGVDRSRTLLEKAQKLFNANNLKGKFIHSDVEQWEPEEGQYHLAMCQTLLMHLTDPKKQIERMYNSVIPGGRVVCIEPNWNAVLANLYIHGLEKAIQDQNELIQKQIKLRKNRTGNDYNIGLKVPIYMREVGLQGIQARVSDQVTYLHPDIEEREHNKIIEILKQTGMGNKINEDAFVESKIKEGLSIDEAEMLLVKSKVINTYFQKRQQEMDLTMAASMIISFGIK